MPQTEPSTSPVPNFLRRHPRGVVLACFFCSGATGLIYEVVWSRRLTLVSGVTVLAYSTVLAAFLGGLAAGSLIFGRIADRRTDPLRLYAMLEAAVGLFCFATPWLFTLVERPGELEACGEDTEEPSAPSVTTSRSGRRQRAVRVGWRGGSARDTGAHTS